MDKWVNAIDKVSDSFRTVFGELTNEQLNEKPAPEVWSIGQNIDHLITTNKSYFPIIESLKKGTYKLPFIAKIGFLVKFNGKMVLSAVQPDRKKRMKTFSVWEPQQSVVPVDILDQFLQHQDQLKLVINNASDLIEKKAIISSPANRQIVYYLHTAFDIIIAHEKRHLEQAKELLPLIVR